MVSIIIPTYKGSNKILLPVLSSLCQTYCPIEIIVVDDNGIGTFEQKKTEEILSFLIKSKKIKYIVHEKNINGSAARNTGFIESNGDYICFLDDDDFMHKTKIEVEVSLLKTKKYDIIVCGSNLVHENGKGYISIPIITDHIQKNYLCDKLKFNTSTMLIKRNVIEQLGGFDTSFRRHQDYEFCIRAMRDFNFGSANEVLLTKYSTNRNGAKNPRQAEQYMDNFIKKIMPYLNLLSKSDKNTILRYRKQILFINFLLSKNIAELFKFCKRKKYRFLICL